MDIKNKELKTRLLLESFDIIKSHTLHDAINLCAAKHTVSYGITNIKDELYRIFIDLYASKQIVSKNGKWILPEEIYPTLIDGYHI